MKTLTYNPETHVLVPREPSNEMCDAATADSCWENMNPPPSTAYRLMLAAAPQPEPNHNWCAGCSPDNCSGCGAEPVESEPVIIEEPNYHFEAMGCGLEDRNITDRYEAMEYGWDCVISRIFERIPDGPLYTTPQPDRTAELEAALRVAREGIDKFLVANDPTEFGCACDLSVGYLCGPCHADKQRQPLKSALAKINEVLHD